MTAARVNARLDDATAKKLAELRRRTGRSTSEIVRDALDNFYRERVTEDRDAAAILRETGFVASAGGSGGLSTQYKREIARSLARKT